MKRLHLLSTSLLTAAAAVLLTGCVMRQTVTRDGEVIKDDYVVKRPLKDALQGS